MAQHPREVVRSHDLINEGRTSEWLETLAEDVEAREAACAGASSR